MLGTLGTMLRYNQGLNQQDTLTRLSERDRSIQERRNRMQLEENKYKSKDQENDGVLGKILSMSASSMIFIGSINKIIETFESSDITNQDQAVKFLSKFDKQASKEDIETILDLVVEQMLERDNEFKKFKFDLETYEFFNKENEMALVEEDRIQNNRMDIVAKQNEIEKNKDIEISMIERINDL